MSDGSEVATKTDTRFLDSGTKSEIYVKFRHRMLKIVPKCDLSSVFYIIEFRNARFCQILHCFSSKIASY